MNMIEIEYGDIEIIDDTIHEEVDTIIEFENDLELTQESYIPNSQSIVVVIYDEYGDRNGIKEFKTYEKALDYCKKQLKPKNIDYDVLTLSEYKTKYGQ